MNSLIGQTISHYPNSKCRDAEKRRKILRKLSVLVILAATLLPARQADTVKGDTSRIITADQLQKLLNKPSCLVGYRSNQSGPLTRIDPKGGGQIESTFTVETIKIPSEGLLINGWLYLPKKEGKYPLVVLTNGGGDDSRPIKSLSDWIAPILAHCGVAAFVHDKRGTGKSEGRYVETTYDDYVADAGNCAVFLSKDKRIDPEMIGVFGGSEGGRIAVLAASRFPIITFVVSFAGAVVGTQEDRIYAQMGGLKNEGASDSLLALVKPLWQRSFAAWASNNPTEHKKVDSEIAEWRKTINPRLLPATKEEFETDPDLKALLPTWKSMSNDYLSELKTFRKKWLAIFGEVDFVVPTKASVNNILRYMAISGNKDYTIAILPQCGHAPVNVETKRLIRIDHLIINWIRENVVKSEQ